MIMKDTFCRVYEQNGKLWKQQASLHPATRHDMVIWCEFEKYLDICETRR